MTRWAAISAVRLPDSTRLTRHAFAMRTINARLGMLAAMLLVMAFFLSAQQEKTIVADTRTGLPLGKYGPFQLIVPGDSRPARWVHNLNSIQLQQAQ